MSFFTNSSNTNETLTELVNQIGSAFLLTNFYQYITYETIETIKEKYISEDEYEDCLVSTIETISKDVNLKEKNVLDDCLIVLRLLIDMFNQLLLQHIDYILIHSYSDQLIKLKNKKEPKSGKTIIVNISLINLALYKEKLRRKWYSQENIIKYILKSIIAYITYKFFFEECFI